MMQLCPLDKTRFAEPAAERRNEVRGFRGQARLPRNPITGIAGCCARAASGHIAAAPPSVAKNFRRPMWLAM